MTGKVVTNVVYDQAVPSSLRYYPSTIIEKITKKGKGTAVFLADTSVGDHEIKELRIKKKIFIGLKKE